MHLRLQNICKISHSNQFFSLVARILRMSSLSKCWHAHSVVLMEAEDVGANVDP